jgi:hypothetical protein
MRKHMAKDSILILDHWLDELPERLQELDSPHIRLYIASCCERTQANYAAFARETGWGDPILMREAGDILWRLDESFSDSYLSAFLNRLKNVIPDTEDFSSDFTSAALDSAVSMLEGIEFLIDANPKHATTICGLVRDTIQMAAGPSHDGPAETGFESIFHAVDLEVEELKRQQADLQTLREVLDLTPQFVAHFRRCAIPNGRSNLGLQIPRG